MYETLCTAQTGSFACLFGCSLLARPLRLGSQRVGSLCSVVSLVQGLGYPWGEGDVGYPWGEGDVGYPWGERGVGYPWGVWGVGTGRGMPRLLVAVEH